MKRNMIFCSLWICAALSATTLAPCARAQNAAGTRILEVDAAAVDKLAGISLSGADAVSLSASKAALQAKPESWQGLSDWVRGGGVVFLHNDAAQLFGYRTVPARRATARVAGQLYGRARSALSFASHPLLWGAPLSTTSKAKNAASLLGVRSVYYQLAAGDHLVVEHPAGVPLLRVSDLAARSNTVLYAAAIAPYGDGWAVFTPSFVEQHRADGALFVQNLMRLVASAPQGMGTRKTTGAALASVSGATLEQAADQFRGAGAADTAAALAQQFGRSLQPYGFGALERNTTPEPAPEAGGKPRLMLTRGEVSTAIALLQGAGVGAPERNRAAAMIDLLRARLELQRGALDKADVWLRLAEQLAPKSAESLLWRGVWQAGVAEDISLPASNRAVLLADAATNWKAASNAPPLAPATADDAVKSISGIPANIIGSWSDSALYSANLMRVEPPLVAPLGAARKDLILRYYQNDNSIRLAIPAGQMLARSDATLGWRAEEEEILIFPQENVYAAYRQNAAPLRGAGPDLGGGYGDVIGNRILMLSQLSLPIILPPATLGGAPRTVLLGTSVPAVLGRLHAHVLINALAQGGTTVPSWMRLGLVTMSNVSMVTEGGAVNINMESLRPYAAAGSLISPAQFRTGSGPTRVAGLADTQSARLMMFFYARFGAGGVVETLQRLGAGESVDDALRATTGLDEAKFFQAWYEAEFPVR